MPASDGWGSFSGFAGYESSQSTSDLVPLNPDVFINGTDSASPGSQWSCASENANPDVLTLSLGADGSGVVTVGDRSEMSISSWQLNDQTVNITAEDGTTVALALTSHEGGRFFADVTVGGLDLVKKECNLER